MRDITIIVPAFNEAQRIEATLKDYTDYFTNTDLNWFILVALNGCQDSTGPIVSKLSEANPRLESIENKEAIGKGGAILEGIRAAPPSKLIGFVDADGATPPDAFHRLIKEMGNCDIAIGSRWLPTSDVSPKQSTKRRILSRIYNFFVNLFFQFGLKDTQCGAKVFRPEIVFKQLDKLVISDMSFDVNLLYTLKRNGGSIKEIPIRWSDKKGTTVHLAKTSLFMALSVIRLRIIYSPIHFLRKPFMKIEMFIYHKLK